jgi:hypothetical protein
MYSTERIAEVDKKIKQIEFELTLLKDTRASMMKEHWDFKKRLRWAEYEFDNAKKLKNTEV